MDCNEVVKKLKNGCNSEVMSYIEKHAEKCTFCDELLRDWFYNQIVGIPELTFDGQVHWDTIEKKIQEKIWPEYKEAVVPPPKLAELEETQRKLKESSENTGHEVSDISPESPCLPEKKVILIESEVEQEVSDKNISLTVDFFSKEVQENIGQEVPEFFEDSHLKISSCSEEMEVKKESAYLGWKYDVRELDGIEEDQLFCIEEENYLAGKSDRREVIHTSEEESIFFIFVCYFCEKENLVKVLQEEQDKIKHLAGKNKKIELERECIICKRRNKFEVPIYVQKENNDINITNRVIKVYGFEPNKS